MAVRVFLFGRVLVGRTEIFEVSSLDADKEQASAGKTDSQNDSDRDPDDHESGRAIRVPVEILLIFRAIFRKR